MSQTTDSDRLSFCFLGNGSGVALHLSFRRLYLKRFSRDYGLHAAMFCPCRRIVHAPISIHVSNILASFR